MSTGDWSELRLLVALLLVVQLVSVLLAWSLNPFGQLSETSYALVLAADLVAFSTISYLVRTREDGRGGRGPFVMAGAGAVLLFMLLALFAQGTI